MHTGLPKPVILPDRMHVTLLPRDNINFAAHALTIQHMRPHGPADWAVILHDMHLRRDGTWSDEKAARDLDAAAYQAWLLAHRHTLADAAALAVDAAAEAGPQSGNEHRLPEGARPFTARRAALIAHDAGAPVLRDRSRESSAALEMLRSLLARTLATRKLIQHPDDLDAGHGPIHYADPDAREMTETLDAIAALLHRWAPASLPQPVAST